MPISTVHHPAQVGRTTVPAPRPTAIGMVSTYPPTQCGLATFSAALIQHLHLSTASLGVVQVVDEAHALPGPIRPQVRTSGRSSGARSAVDAGPWSTAPCGITTSCAGSAA